MKWIQTLCLAFSEARHAVPHRPRVAESMLEDAPPRDFGEAVAYLAWYVTRLPEYRMHNRPDGTPCHLSLCHRFMMAWLRNELVDDKLPVNVRGEDWSL